MLSPWLGCALAVLVAGQDLEPSWAAPMREAHARFQGRKGTLALFGDSITVSLAFWAGLPHDRKNASREMEEAFATVNAYLRPECWREWRGPEYGNEGSTTVRWAHANVARWLEKLDPEAAVIMFGTNDLGELEAGEYRTKLKEIVARCLEHGTVPILSTAPPRSGFAAKAEAFAAAARQVAREARVPLMDYHAEILRRRPEDWDGSLEKFKEWKDYDVPTLISRDGVHPSHPAKYQGDYSEEALRSCGFSLRSYLVLLKYAEVLDRLRGLPALSPPRLPWVPRVPPPPPPRAVSPRPDAPPAEPPRDKTPRAEAPRGEAQRSDVPRAETILVRDVKDLFDAVARVRPGGTVLVADGLYRLPRRLEIRTGGLTLRGASCRRERVVLDGGAAGLGELLAITGASDVTIADLTIQEARWNGFKIDSETGVHRLTIRNCIVHNVWQRGVKGVLVPEADRERIRPSGSRIEDCLFYNDRAKRSSDDPADRPDNFGGDYIGGIDVMFPSGWTVSDNVFVGIQGRTRQGRGAVFLWHDARDCVVERNVIVDCDSGICLGNSYRPEGIQVHATRCVVRDNFVVRAPENGILADYTAGSRILHNTVHDPGSRLGRLIRLVHGNEGILVANNLLSGPGLRNESNGAVELRGNLVGDFTGSFAAPERGDLHLKAPLDGPQARTEPLPDARADIDREARPERPHVGADEPAARG